MSRSSAGISLAMLLAVLGAAGPACFAAEDNLPTPPAVREFENRMRTEVTHFGFEEPVVTAPDALPIPGEWERHLEYREPEAGPAGKAHIRYFGLYPDFLAVEVMERRESSAKSSESVHGGRRAVRLSLGGSRDMDRAAIKRRIPLDVDPRSAYELTGFVRLQGARKSEARLGIEWLDDKGQTIGDRPKLYDNIHWTEEPVNAEYVARCREKSEIDAAGWVRVPKLRINDVPEQARAMRIWCQTIGRDPDGWAYFDDIDISLRPKIAVSPDSEISSGIFRESDYPAVRLSFNGLGIGPGSSGEAPVSYVRVMRITDLFGRKFPVLERPFKPQDVRAGNIDEGRVSLESIKQPGAYSVDISLLAVDKRGGRTEVAHRVLCVVKLAKDPMLSDERGYFGVEADMSDAIVRLAEAAVRLGGEPRQEGATQTLALRIKPSDRALLSAKLRELLNRRLQVQPVLNPVPDRELRHFYTAESADRRDQVLMELNEALRPYAISWRLGGAESRVFQELGQEEREALGRQLRERSFRTVLHKIMVAPLAFDALAIPAAKLDANSYYREMIFVPAGETPEGLRRRLAERFPRAVETAAAGSGREWFLQLQEAGDALSQDMESERIQVQDMARKATILAAAGATRFFTELSHPQRGLFNADLQPRPAAAAWRTLGLYLAGAKFLGEYDLAPGVSAWAFQRGETGMVVYWSDGQIAEAAAQLGTRGQTKLIEITGGERGLRSASAAESAGLKEAEMVPLSPMPAILFGMEPAFIQTRLSFRLAADTRVESCYESQKIVFEVHNYFKSDMVAKIFPRFPQGASVVPRFRQVTIKPGENSSVDFTMRPSFMETVGDKEVQVDLYLSTNDRRDELFTLKCRYNVHSDITVSPVIIVDPDRRSARVQLSTGVAASAQYKRDSTDLDVFLSVPGQTRHRLSVENVPIGKSLVQVDPFTVLLGQRVQTAYLGVRDRNSNRFINMEIKLPAIDTPPGIYKQ